MINARFPGDKAHSSSPCYGALDDTRDALCRRSRSSTAETTKLIVYDGFSGDLNYVLRRCSDPLENGFDLRVGARIYQHA